MRWESSFVCVFCFVWGGGRGRSFGNCLILLVVSSMKLKMCMAFDVTLDKLIHGDKRATILCLGTNQRKKKKGASHGFYLHVALFLGESYLYSGS